MKRGESSKLPMTMRVDAGSHPSLQSMIESSRFYSQRKKIFFFNDDLLGMYFSMDSEEKQMTLYFLQRLYNL